MRVCTNVLILFILFDSDVLDEIIPTMLFPKCSWFFSLLNAYFVWSNCIFVWGVRSIEPQGCASHVLVLNHILIWCCSNLYTYSPQLIVFPKQTQVLQHLSLSMAISGKLELPKGYKTCVRRYSNCFWPCSIVAGASKFRDSGTPSWNLCEGVESWGWRFGFKNHRNLGKMKPSDLEVQPLDEKWVVRRCGVCQNDIWSLSAKWFLNLGVQSSHWALTVNSWDLPRSSQ